MRGAGGARLRPAAHDGVPAAQVRRVPGACGLQFGSGGGGGLQRGRRAEEAETGEQGGAAAAEASGGTAQQKGDGRQQVVHACPCAKTPGHTGYLTFARRAAAAAGQEADAAADENGGQDAGT